MRTLNFILLNTICLALIIGFTGGCAGKKADENDVAALYQEAEDDIKSDHYQMALDKLKQIKNRFPYSKYAAEAELRIADVHYMQESYDEAAASYEAFRDLHPKHEKVAYAMFRAGKSYFNDIPSTIARDQSPTQKAVDSLNEFIRRFPKAPEIEEARKLVTVSRHTLAEKELYIGNFYYKRSEYDAAKGRYLKIIELYPETGAAKEAKEKLNKLPSKVTVTNG